MKTQEFAKILFDINSIKFGEFTLKSGETSPIYLDLRNIISYPHLLKQISQTIKEEFGINFNRVCGVPYAAMPLATTFSLENGVPLIIKRKEVKKWGTGKLIEGEFNPGDNILLIEDVVTSGTSLIETIKEIEKVGLNVSQIITIVDREQGGIEKIRDMGYQISALFTIKEMLESLQNCGSITNIEYVQIIDYLNKPKSPNKLPKKSFPKNSPHPKSQKLLDISWEKKTNIIASVDLTKSEDILNFLDKIGGGICAAKLHVDIIEDFSQNFIDNLKKIANDKNFLLIEDRKFADIGNTFLLQVSGGIHKINLWADFVTIHLIGGESVLKSYQDWDTDSKPGLIPILQMSSQGTLTDENYLKNCLEVLNNYKDVVGCVCQTYKPQNGLLKFTPGIHSSSLGDNKGQRYVTPQYAMEHLESDFLIVGRGLYSSQNPEQDIKIYLESVKKLFQ